MNSNSLLVFLLGAAFLMAGIMASEDVGIQKILQWRAPEGHRVKRHGGWGGGYPGMYGGYGGGYPGMYGGGYPGGYGGGYGGMGGSYGSSSWGSYSSSRSGGYSSYNSGFFGK